jgi:hypothetical protein
MPRHLSSSLRPCSCANAFNDVTSNGSGQSMLTSKDSISAHTRTTRHDALRLPGWAFSGERRWCTSRLCMRSSHLRIHPPLSSTAANVIGLSSSSPSSALPRPAPVALLVLALVTPSRAREDKTALMVDAKPTT